MTDMIFYSGACASVVAAIWQFLTERNLYALLLGLIGVAMMGIAVAIVFL